MGNGRKAWWKSWIPHYVTNRQMLWFYGKAAGLFRMPEARIAANRKENRKLLLAEDSPLKAGRYIENQAEWGKVRFGCSKRSNMAYSGCEIIAAYNAKLALGEHVSALDMAELIARYERKGAALRGAIGTSPKEIACYFEERGYEVRMTDSRDPETLEIFGRENDTVIVTAYNDRNDITREIHTVSVTKDEKGEYTLHNVYSYDRGRRCYAAKGSYAALQEAVRNIASDPEVICVIGIVRKR